MNNITEQDALKIAFKAVQIYAEKHPRPALVDGRQAARH